MALSKTKIIEEIDDLSEMFQAMAALGISCKGLKTLDDMKARARAELSQTPNKPSWTAGQVWINWLWTEGTHFLILLRSWGSFLSFENRLSTVDKGKPWLAGSLKKRQDRNVQFASAQDPQRSLKRFVIRFPWYKFDFDKSECRSFQVRHPCSIRDD